MSGVRIEWCRDVCERPWWHADPVFGGGQLNCPYRFGVDHAAATVDGKRVCEHLKRKESE